ncbi:hypothetical protein TNCV_814361 [Trichonephila clavipes]|nr:hypothetical protein TNCV_814361 [Trichonephila clavipes]
MKKDLDLFLTLSRDEKSSKCTDPTDKLFNVCLKETTGPVQTRGWGGTAILIKRSIPHFHVPTPPPYSVEKTSLRSATPSDQEPFLVASIYAPPGPNYRNLGADLDCIFNIFKSAFLAGDYNAKHTPGAVITATPEALEDNLSTMNAEDNFWGIKKAFRKKTSRFPPLMAPTGIALSDTNKTEVIAHSLEKQFFTF